MINSSDDIKEKSTKRCAIKRKLKFEDYKNCLQATQLENKIKHVKKNEIDINSFKKDYKDFIKNNKLILKTLQSLESVQHNVFTEEINTIALSSNDDKRMQSIDSTETYAYETGKDLVSEKQEIKCNYIIKTIQK